MTIDEHSITKPSKTSHGTDWIKHLGDGTWRDYLEDLPADPVDELLNLNGHADGVYVKESDLVKAADERASYGIATRDIWDFGGSWIRLLAVATREQTATDDYADKVRRDFFIEGCIALNEVLNTNDLAFFVDSEKSKEELQRWNEKWDPEVTRFKNVLSLEWLGMPVANQPLWNHDDIDAIFTSLGKDFTYDIAKELISDPILVDDSSREKHYQERRDNGYSTVDLDSLRTFMMWTLVQGCVFFASNNSMGWPVSEAHPTMKGYQKYMLKTAKAIMHGEVAVSKVGELTKEEKQYIADYRVVIASLTTMLPTMWD